MKLSLKSTIKLNNGVEIPRLGLGTWQLAQGEECTNSVRWALQAGYQHIDTAKIYRNEESVGRGIVESGVSRKDIFLTTKLWNEDHGNVEKAFRDSLNKLNVDYVDLYLIHWPVPQRIKSWKKLEELYQTGAAKAIGVSNFTIRHLDELLPNCTVVPAVNQVEFSPFLYQKELLEYCRTKSIQLECYSPLTRSHRLDEPALTTIAARHGKTPAQILIRWALQKDLVVIPKSSRQKHIIENSNVYDFELDNEEEKILNGLNEDYRVTWDPSEMP